MKEKINQTVNQCGIKIVNNINFTVPKHNELFNTAILIITAFFGLFGTVFSFTSMFNLEIENYTIAIFSTIFFCMFTIIFLLPFKFQFSLIPILVFYGILLYKCREEFVQGFKTIYNRIYTSIFPKRGEYFDTEFSNSKNAKLFLIFALFLISLFICYATLSHPNFIIGFLSTFPFIECGLYYGIEPDIIPALMLVTFWGCLISIQYCGYNQHLKINTSGFTRKGVNFYAKPGISYKLSGISSLFIILISFIIFGAIFLTLNLTEFSRPKKIDTIKTNLKNAASAFTFDDLSTSLENFSLSLTDGNFRVYSNKLGTNNSISFKNSTDLIITSDILPPDNIYLKGYVGSYYSENQWKELPDSIYKQNIDMFNSFSQNENYPQMIFSDFLTSNYEVDYFKIDIKSNFLNERYNYTPYYGALPIGNIDFKLDTIISLESKSNYSFKIPVSMPNFDNFNFFDDLSYNEFSTTSEKYHDFLYDYYCDYPQTQEMSEIYNQFISSDFKELPLESRLNKIKEILSSNATYTLSPGKTPSDKDFVNYFLLENHKGYCVHFASAATILCRMAGIPARYATGYVATPEDFKNNSSGNVTSYRAEIKDNRAHAWTEIYIDGFGWQPFEFTPPSAAALNESTETIETTEASSAIKKSASSKGTAKPSEKTKTYKKTDISSSVISSPQKSNSKSISKANTQIITIIIIVTLITSFLLSLILKRKFNLIKRHKNLNNANLNVAVLHSYDYFLDLLEFEGISNNNTQYLEFAKIASDKSKILKNIDFEYITSIALKAKLSKEKITEADKSYLNETSAKAAKHLYIQSSPFKKMYMKYIKNLI